MAKKKYKIVYVGNFDTLSVGEPEVARSFEEFGHTIVRLDERFASIEQVRIACESSDMLLFAKFRVGNPKERWEFLRDLKIPKIMWGFDLYFGL